MKLPHTEVKFYPEAKSQTGLSSLRVSCKRAHRMHNKKVVEYKQEFDVELVSTYRMPFY